MEFSLKIFSFKICVKIIDDSSKIYFRFKNSFKSFDFHKLACESISDLTSDLAFLSIVTLNEGPSQDLKF